LLSVFRSNFYYQSANADDSQQLEVVNRLAARVPTYGSRGLAAQLRRAPYGQTGNRKRAPIFLKERVTA